MIADYVFSERLKILREKSLDLLRTEYIGKPPDKMIML